MFLTSTILYSRSVHPAQRQCLWRSMLLSFSVFPQITFSSFLKASPSWNSILHLSNFVIEEHLCFCCCCAPLFSLVMNLLHFSLTSLASASYLKCQYTGYSSPSLFLEHQVVGVCLHATFVPFCSYVLRFTPASTAGIDATYDSSTKQRCLDIVQLAKMKLLQDRCALNTFTKAVAVRSHCFGAFTGEALRSCGGAISTLGAMSCHSVIFGRREIHQDYYC